MEVNLYKNKEIINVVKEPILLSEFKQTLNQHKPTEFFNNSYSRVTPCWVITEYLDENTVMYYANGWADKTPREVSIEKLYNTWRIQGLNNTMFYVGEEEIKDDEILKRYETHAKVTLVGFILLMLFFVGSAVMMTLFMLNLMTRE